MLKGLRAYTCKARTMGEAQTVSWLKILGAQ